MEDNKLNLNQPLLSVRRNPSSPTSERVDDRRMDDFRLNIPRYKSELKSGPLRKPGTVPFQWEQTPGQPKNEIRPRFKCSDRPPVAPKLPPGRYSKAIQQDFHHLSPVDKEVEQTVNLPVGSITGPSRYEGNRDVGKCEEATEEIMSCTSGECDEAYVDAPDTLCRTESSLMNCSVSGLSGLDDLDVNTTTGNFSGDPHTRELMMDRFLPAAKAMASEIPQPQYAASKKQSTVQEQLKQKTVGQDRPTLRYGPSFAKRYGHFCDNERDDDDEDEEESGDEYDHHQSSPAICGLLPRFCLKGSVYFPNPVPGMSVRTRAAPFSPATRARPRSSSSGSFTEIENEKSGIPQLKLVRRPEIAEDEEKNVILKNETTQLGIHNQLEAGDAPPPVTGKKEVIAQGCAEFRGFRTFQEYLVDNGSRKELESGGSVIEKTVYVDTVQNVETKRPFSPIAQDTGVLSSGKEMDKMQVLDSSLEDLKKLAAVNWEVTVPAKSYEFSDFNVASSTETENMDIAESKASEDLGKQVPTLDNCQKRYSQLPVPPPLPKSPSDSWLFRTLPSISSKNASGERLFLGGTTKPQNQNLHNSKEQLAPIPET